MRSRVHRLVLSAALATSLALGLAACGDDEPSGDPPASTPTDSTSDSSSGAGTDGPSEEPTAEAATGPQLESRALRMRVFAAPGWDVRTLGSLMGASLDTDDGLFEVRVSGLETTATDLEAAAERAEEDEFIDRTAPKRVENRVVDGVELFVLDGRAEGDRTVILGGYHGGFQVNIDLDFPDDWPDADALIESMLASVEWK